MGQGFLLGYVTNDGEAASSGRLLSLFAVIRATFIAVGRHRNDPRGVGQVMAIVGAVVLLVTLVALGGYFLYRALPGTGTSVSANASEAAADAVESDEMGVLYIRVVGESSKVFVRVPGGDVLLDQELTQGSSVNYPDNANGLEVTIGEPTAVEVYVNGDHRDISDRDPGHSFTLKP
jgi:hypothetical protein